MNTCYITALYNFPLWLASHPVGQRVSHLFPSRPACLAPPWQPASRAHMYVCCSPGRRLSHLQANYGWYLLSGRNKNHRIEFSAALFWIQYWSAGWCRGFLALRILTSCLEINLNASWLFRGETYRTAGMPCYSRSGLVSRAHVVSLYLYLWPLTLHSPCIAIFCRCIRSSDLCLMSRLNK